MNIVPYEAEHLMTLQLQEGQLHCAPAISPEYARALENEFAFAAVDGDRVLAVGGVTPLWENRALAWTFIDRDAGPHFAAIHKATKALLDLCPYRRIEADTPCDFEQGHRWLRMLGFQMEAERMRAHRVDGGDSSLYALVKHG